MTIVNENATLCGTCSEQMAAYRRGMREQWETDFFDIYGREPTDKERFHAGPGFGRRLGPEGYPDCPDCKGAGIYMEPGKPEGALMSVTLLPRVPITEATEEDPPKRGITSIIG